jgi:phosphotransferase system  glucose/maltose/N-acetylglucosamine-specific IIC component
MRISALGGLFPARPGMMLRIEGATLLVAGAMLYWMTGGSWWLFALLLFTPDVSMLGYLFGPGIGAVVYNVFHAYPLPVALAIFALLVGVPLVLSVALVWLVHIGLDRLLGYGLKYPDGFKNTHLGRM